MAYSHFSSDIWGSPKNVNKRIGFYEGFANDTMQYISQLNLPDFKSRGGRIASPKLREAIELCEDFTGLEEGVNRYDLLLLVKRAGRIAGFSPRMIALLDYYMAFTRDIDWEEGSRPIVYKSLSSTALDMGVSERQIQALEKQLFEIGAITWNDSGNHRRYGQRCDETGQILYAFGVELTPLAYLKAKLQDALHEKQLYDKAWQDTKRQISYYRRQIRSILLEAEARLHDEDEVSIMDQADIAHFAGKYNAIAYQIRTSLDLDHTRSLLSEHKVLFADLSDKVQDYDQQAVLSNNQKTQMGQITDKDSCMSEEKFTDYKYTKQKPLNKLSTSRPSPNFLQEGVAERPQPQSEIELNGKDRRRAGGIDQDREDDPSQDQDIISSTGLQHVSLKQLLNISSERFMEQFPIQNRPMNHSDFIEAAYKLKDKLGISQNSWGHACMTLGRIGAAVCVILTDQANLREENRVMKPGAYFNAMINRAKSGELKLHKSVMGHLKREYANDDGKSSKKITRI